LTNYFHVCSPYCEARYGQGPKEEIAVVAAPEVVSEPTTVLVSTLADDGLSFLPPSVVDDAGTTQANAAAAATAATAASAAAAALQARVAKWQTAASLPLPRSVQIAQDILCFTARLVALKAELRGLETERRRAAEACPDLYMLFVVESLFNWHVANLEYGNATSVDKISLEHWDQDDDFAFIGSHLVTKEGFSSFATALAVGCQGNGNNI
jgi:hypothetical protein